MSGEMYEVDKSKVAAAFDAWQQVHGRADGGAYDAFRRSVHASCRLRAPQEDLQQLPGSRQTWSDWRRSSKTKKLKLVTCQAIYELTGRALVARHLLDKRRNLTTAVKITQSPTARLVGNAPDAQGHETYAVSAHEIRFRKSDAQTVTKDWLGARGKDGETVIGSVVFGLRNAAIQIAAAGEIKPVIELLKANRDEGAKGVSLSYDGNGRWLVDTEEGEVHLLGALNLTDFAHVRDTPDGGIELAVEVQEGAIDPIFSVITNDLERDAKKSMARSHLLKKVLKLALAERGDSLVFAIAHADKACQTQQ